MLKKSAAEANGEIRLPTSLPVLAHSEGLGNEHNAWRIYNGDARQILPRMPAEYFNCVVTSPPYFWQRDYEAADQIGLEKTIKGYVNVITGVMADVYRTLAKDGLLFLNLGDTYYSRKGEPKGKDRKN